MNPNMGGRLSRTPQPMMQNNMMQNNMMQRPNMMFQQGQQMMRNNGQQMQNMIKMQQDAVRQRVGSRAGQPMNVNLGGQQQKIMSQMAGFGGQQRTNAGPQMRMMANMPKFPNQMNMPKMNMPKMNMPTMNMPKM